MLAVWILRELGASIPVIFFGGRLAGLAAYLALVFLAIRIAPRGKVVLLVVGAMPMALQSAASYTADTMTLALALLTVALTLRCSADSKAGWWFGGLSAVVVGLALTKPTYVLLATLLLLVPNANLSTSALHASLAKAGVLLLVACAAGLWYFATRHITLAPYFPPGRIVPHEQLSYIFHHPFGYAKVLARTQTLGSSQYIFPSFVSAVSMSNIALPPVEIVIFAFLLLAGAYQTEVGSSLLVRGRQLIAAWWPVALSAIVAVAIFTALWVEWTPVGSRTIYGIQGRYLLPIAAVPVMTVILLRARRPVLHEGWFFIGMAILALYEILTVLTHFY